MVEPCLLLLFAPFVTGYVQKLKARFQCRRGASVFQPYRDVWKLLGKETVQSDSASSVFRAIPLLVLGATVVAASLVPVLWLPGTTQPGVLHSDAILALALFTLARFLTAISALDAGGAFGGMGASREMTVGALVEPVLMLAIFSLAVGAGTTSLAGLAEHRLHLGAFAWNAADLLALFSMLVLLLAETGRIPVDNPDTHLELTMLHEGMVLEHSGPGLACLTIANHVKQLVLICIIGALFVPAGMATEASWSSASIAFLVFGLRVFVLATYLAVVESSYAKLRLFRVPQFLGIALVCGFLALALRML